MKSLLAAVVMPLGLAFALAGHAQVPTAAPAATTGLCKDGSYTDADSKRGACRGHKGVKEWYGASATAAAAAPVRTAAAPSPVAAAPAAPPTAAATKSSPAQPATRSAPAESDLAKRTATPGGGAGKVRVNTETKVYHCSTDRYYGKTKQGEYLSEADAIAKGNHAAHGKACSA